eukprot:11734242-Heterocapsa_arctica.AAC.1
MARSTVAGVERRVDSADVERRVDTGASCSSGCRWRYPTEEDASAVRAWRRRENDSWARRRELAAAAAPRDFDNSSSDDE